MDFTLDDEQVALRDAVRGMLKDVDPTGLSERSDPWSGFAEMGLTALASAEDDGGSGAGPLEVAVVAEEVGRAGARVPFLESSVLAASLIASCGTPEQRAELIGGLADGSRVPVVAGLEPQSRWALAGGTTSYADGKVTGVKEPVTAGPRADVLLVTALIDDEHTGVFVVDAADAQITTYDTLDGRRASRIVLDGTPATPLGEAVDRTDEISLALATAQIAACAEALGAMDTALRLTTEYLRTRQQFGVTLNRFQSLTFRAADMYTQLELTRSMVSWATMVLAERGEDHVAVTEAAARAVLQTSRAGRLIGQEAIQLHGGIGMTQEYAVGHFTARLTALDHLFGDGRAQIGKLAERLTAHGVVDPLD